MFLGKYKKAERYFARAYKVAVHESQYEFASKIAFEIAKIHIKYGRFKTAKSWLDEVVSNNEGHMEAYLLKARLSKILGQKEEFKVLLENIYRQILQG